MTSSRLLSQGTVVDQLDFLPRLAQVLNCTLPESALQLNGQEQFKKLPLKEANADGRCLLYDSDGVASGGMFDSAAANVSYPKVTSVDENRYVSIPPNSKRIVSFQPIGSIWQSALCWPLSHASLTWEGMLASSAAEICAGSTIPHATVGALGAQARSQQFQILPPHFECSLITPSSVGQSDFDALISSSGLNHSLTSDVTLHAQVQGKDIRTSFSRSLANIKEIYVTLYRDPVMAPTNNANDNAFLNSWLKAFNKKCNYLFGGVEEILQRCSPTYRGALDANGRPTATPGAAGMDAGVPQMTQAEAIAADKALSDKPTTFTAELGAKKLTDQPCAGGSIVYHNKLTQGIEALRESFGQPESFTQGRRIFSLNCEKFVAGLSENGLSSRGSEVLQIVMDNMGTDAIHASEIYVTLVYETKLHVTTGVVRIRS